MGSMEGQLLAPPFHGDHVRTVATEWGRCAAPDEVTFKVIGSAIHALEDWSEPVHVRVVRMPSGQYEMEMRRAS